MTDRDPIAAPTSRRDFLRLAGAGALGAAVGVPAAGAASKTLTFLHDSSFIRDFDAYFKLEPSDVGAHVDLAEALAKHGQHELALGEYQLAARSLGKDPERRLEALLARLGARVVAIEAAFDPEGGAYAPAHEHHHYGHDHRHNHDHDHDHHDHHHHAHDHHDDP